MSPKSGHRKRHIVFTCVTKILTDLKAYPVWLRQANNYNYFCRLKQKLAVEKEERRFKDEVQQGGRKGRKV